MSLKEIEIMVRSLKNPLESLIITGGEPFLREDLVEICKIFFRLNKTKKIIIATNGTIPSLVYEKTKKILNEIKIDLTVQVSIDGLKKTHDKIRGVNGCFDKAIKTVQKLKEFKKNPNFSLNITTTISKENLNELEELTKFVKEKLQVFHGLQFMRNSVKHSFGVPRDFIADFDKEDGLLTVNEMKSTYEKIKKFGLENESPLLRKLNNTINEHILYILSNKKPALKCKAGIVDCVIYSNGDVSMCEFTKTFANLKTFDFNFYKLWKSPLADHARKKINNCFCIHSCNLINSMKFDRKSVEKLLS